MKNQELGKRERFSSYADLRRILETVAALRFEAGAEVSCVEGPEKIVEGNFRAAFLTNRA
jgi:hypothetical protein